MLIAHLGSDLDDPSQSSFHKVSPLVKVQLVDGICGAMAGEE
jgi:hypothetical protein